MLRYALRTLRARRAGLAGTFVALACASALVTASGAFLETGLRGTIDTERYAGTPIVVSGDQDLHYRKHAGDKTKDKAKPLAERVWLPADTVQRIEAVPGLRAAVPELSFPASVVSPDGRFVGGPDGTESLGHSWTSAALTPFRIVRGHAPTARNEIALDQGLASHGGLAPGDVVTVQATGEPASYTVAGVAATPAGELEQQAAVFFAASEAERLAGHPGRYAAIGVLPVEGARIDTVAADVTAALAGTGAKVRTGSDRGAVEFLAASKARVELIGIAGAVGAIGLLVAMLVVAGTIGLSIQQRHREIAVLRSVGATPRQTRRLIGRETLFVGLLASLVGAAAGLPLAAWLYGKLVDVGTVTETLGLVRSPLPIVVAIAATLLSACAVARLSTRRATRIRPAEALTEAAVEPRRLGPVRFAVGTLALVGGLALLGLLAGLRTEPAALPVSYLVVLALSIALALLGPAAARLALAGVGAPLRLSPVAGFLAANNARANARRLAAVMTPLALLVALACTVLFVQTTLANAARRQVRRGIVADWVVDSAGPGVPSAAADRLRQLPRSSAVTEVVHTTVRSPDLARYTLQGVTPEALGTSIDLDVTEGSLAGLDRGGVAVSDVVADGKGLHPGDAMKLVLGDGTPVTLKVVAVYTRGLGFGDLTAAHDLVAAHVDNPLDDAVLVATPEQDDDAVAREALLATMRAFPGTGVTDGARFADRRAAERNDDAEVSYLLMGLVLTFTAIASFNAMIVSTAGRARELGTLRLAGLTRAQVLRMLRLEALTVAFGAMLIGTGIALATLVAFSIGMTGEPSPSLSPTSYLAIVAAAAALAVTATELAGRMALRERPTDATGADA